MTITPPLAPRESVRNISVKLCFRPLPTDAGRPFLMGEIRARGLRWKEKSMPLARYGVLKGHAIERRLGQGNDPHYEVHIISDDVSYRIAVNVESKESPHEVQYLVDDNFQHPITAGLLGLPLGFTAL